MICEKCGKQVDYINVLGFCMDGSDRYERAYIEEAEEDAVVIETRSNWTGYELSEEEQIETIACPHCGQFPFEHKEIQVEDVVRLVFFKSETTEKRITKFDRIKAMSVDEMATVIYNGISSDPCDYCEHNNGHCTGEFCKDKANADIIAEWLERMVTDDDT